MALRNRLVRGVLRDSPLPLSYPFTGAAGGEAPNPPQTAVSLPYFDVPRTAETSSSRAGFLRCRVLV